MLNLADYYRCIKKMLETSFSNINVQIKDIKNPAPPCFYIKPINTNSIQSAKEFETSNISFDIIYFSCEETLLDLFNVQKELQKVFQAPLKVSKENEEEITFIEISNIDFSFNEEDYILNCTIDIEDIHRLDLTQIKRYEAPDNYKGIPLPSEENIEELQIN